MTQGVYADLESLIALRHQSQGFSFLPRQPIHSLLAGQKASRLRGRGLNFEEIRNYLPGDDIRNIDWKVTARMRAPHMRVYTEERDRPVLLVVDQRLNMFFGSQRSMKSVTAAETAALGAWRVLGVGDRVGAIVFNDTETAEVRPHRSARTVMRILGAIVAQNGTLRSDGSGVSRPECLNETLERACRLVKHDALVCIISDFDGADEHTKHLITRLGRHNDILAGLVYDPLEAELPDLGPLVVGDGELQVEVDTGNANLRKRFADIFSERLAEIRQFLLRREIPVLPLHTGLPVPEQVRKLLGHRPLRGSR
ncbi:MAG: DUF58 domain-containing protein [Hyphomicrobiaceae bacterium]|nr:DUF58 domain-containing protein [Hyphomicrobiaceae bacterium]